MKDKLHEIDRYIEALCGPANDAFQQALHEAKTAGLPPINVSPNEGKFLYLLTKLTGARRVLEIGLLGGYSAMWLASALPDDGQLVTLEIEPRFASVARQNLQRAGLINKVEVHVGPARESLAKLIAANTPPFDVVFIDADKEGYPVYLEHALQLVHPGSLILADNVIRDGKVTNADDPNPSVRAVREFNQKLASNPRLETILLPIMRANIDGLAIARVR